MTDIRTLITQIAHTDNRTMGEIRDALALQSPAYRARVIERLSAMIGAIAERDAEAPTIG